MNERGKQRVREREGGEGERRERERRRQTDRQRKGETETERNRERERAGGQNSWQQTEHDKAVCMLTCSRLEKENRGKPWIIITDFCDLSFCVRDTPSR